MASSIFLHVCQVVYCLVFLHVCQILCFTISSNQVLPIVLPSFATMGPTWHNGRPMTTKEYKVVKKVWLGNVRTLYNFKDVALLKRCWFARGHEQIMIWRRDDFVDPHTGILLFGQKVDLESDSD